MYVCLLHAYTHYVYEISEHTNNIPCTACLRVTCVIHSTLSTAAVGGGDCGVYWSSSTVYFCSTAIEHVQVLLTLGGKYHPRTIMDNGVCLIGAIYNIILSQLYPINSIATVYVCMYLCGVYTVLNTQDIL